MDDLIYSRITYIFSQRNTQRLKAKGNYNIKYKYCD